MMPRSDQPLPAAGPTREEVARIEVGHTTVGPATTSLLLVSFLVAIAVVPLAELIGVQALRAQGLATAWSHLSGVPGQVRSRVAAAAGETLWRRVVAGNRAVLGALTAFERALEDESRLGRVLRPPAQAVMSAWLGVGNERVYHGRDGWLFYRPDVEHVTGRGFLDRAELERRVLSATEWDEPPQPDPRAALRQFARDLEARGIALVLMPTPLKPAVHPERLSRRYEPAASVLHNPSFRAFVDGMTQEGVLVFEPSEALSRSRGPEPAYLATDTHWRPETMEAVAGRLAAFLRDRVELPPAADPVFRIERLEVVNRGDTAKMLDLPALSLLYPPESVWLRRVLQDDGSLWRSSREADVLVLGDSFSNIYSLESMGWGTSAGFVEQLSDALGRPVDRLVQNDEAAFATRAMLQQQPERLSGKRVVVYQFAARELSFGDWKVLPLDDPAIP